MLVQTNSRNAAQKIYVLQFFRRDLYTDSHQRHPAEESQALQARHEKPKGSIPPTLDAF